MLQTDGGKRPAHRELGHVEHPALILPQRPVQLGGLQARLAGQRQPDAYHALDGVRGEVEALDALVESLTQPSDLLTQVALELEHPSLRRALLGLFGLQPTTMPRHGLFDLGGDHRAHVAEIVTDRLDLLGRHRQELQVGLQRARLGLAPASPDEVVDQHLRAGLAVPVNAAVALLETVGIPRNLDMHHPVTVALQVDALAGRVGGQQDPYRRFRRVVLEVRLDAFALVGVHAAVQQLEAVAGQAASGQALGQPLLSMAVFGEDDDPLVGPRAVGAYNVGDPIQQQVRLRVASVAGALGPGRHAVQQRLFLVRQRGGEALGGVIGLVPGLLAGILVAVVGLDLVAGGGQHPLGRVGGQPPARLGQARAVLGEGVRERCRGGEQPLLQQGEHELGGNSPRAAAGLLCGLGARFRIGAQCGVHVAFVVGVVDLDRHDGAGGIAGRAVGVGGQLGLEAAHHDPLELLASRGHASGKPLVVE
jgi:hypothetical protein